MPSSHNDRVYADWMSKWRLWKHAWCESDEPVVEFYLQFISKERVYGPVLHAEFASRVGASSIDKKTGVIEVRNGAVVLPTISKVYEDQFGVVTLKLSFFSRREILSMALVLENLGHGVLHDGGIIVGSSVKTMNPRKMPCRDDPVWLIIEEGLKSES